MTEYDDIPMGNGDVVRTRELYESERRTREHFDEKVKELGDEFREAIVALAERVVFRDADKARHEAIDGRLVNVETVTGDHTRRLYIGVGIGLVVSPLIAALALALTFAVSCGWIGG